MTAAKVPWFLTETLMVTWPRTGPTHLRIPGVVVCIAMITKSGSRSRKTLPDGNVGPPGGICWRPRCCASDADGGRARAATTMTVSNVPDRVMTFQWPGAAPCDLVVFSSARLVLRNESITLGGICDRAVRRGWTKALASG